MTNETEPTTSDATTPEPNRVDESALDGTASTVAAESEDDGPTKALDARIDRDIELMQDPTTSAGQHLLAMRTDFRIAASRFFRAHLSPASVSALDEISALDNVAAEFCAEAMLKK